MVMALAEYRVFLILHTKTKKSTRKLKIENIIGEFLQRKRTEKQITLRKMAEMIGITAPYLTDIEKDRRNPPEKEKLELISQILMLNDEDKTTMYDLAGKKRNSVAPDLPNYIMEHDYVSAALRTARDLEASEADWLKFVEELRQRKG